MWQKHYKAPQPNLWQGRADSQKEERFFQIVQCIDLSVTGLTKQSGTLAFGLIGFCCDIGIKRNLGRIGAAQAPEALRKVLANFPIQLENITFYDVGDIKCEDDDLESAQQSLATLVAELIHHGIKPIVIGGGHETAWGHYQGLALLNPKPDPNLGIINFDAHFDLRPLLAGNKGSSGTPFLQIAQARQAANQKFSYYCLGIQKYGNTKSLFSTAKELDTQYINAEEIHLQPIQQILNSLDHFINQQTPLYVSLCMDVFASSVAPGVSAPQALGLYPWQVIPLLRHLVRSEKIISFDLVELSPPLDPTGKTTQLAASLIAEYIHSHLP